MIDIHTHVAYGIDDGADDFGEALELIDKALQNGANGIVLTPHYPNKVFGIDKSKAEYLEYINSVIARLSAERPNVTLYSGAENYCSESTSDLISKGEIITLNNSRYALIEFSERESFEFVSDTVRYMVKHDYVPIIAHTERYLCIDYRPERAKQLKNAGALLQVNARSVMSEGRYHLLADYLLRHRLADVVASDAHEPYIRSTDISGAIAEMAYRYSSEYLQRLTNDNPRAILADLEFEEEEQ